MVCSHLLMEKIGKWTLAVLDMVRINTQTVLIINNDFSNTNSFDFGWDMVKALPTPSIESCKSIYQNH